MSRPLIESLESRQFLSASIMQPFVSDQAIVPVAMATVAPAAVTAPTLGWSYAGKYKIGTTSKAVSLVFDRAYTGGLYAITVTDAGMKYAGNAVLAGNALTINWFTYAADGSQVPVGTIDGTLDAAFGVITGPITRNGLTGTASLTRKDVPVAQLDYNYVGSYTIAGVTRKISIRLVKRYTNMYYINVLDGGTLYDGNMYSSGGVTYINWFKYDAQYNQVPIGTISGTWSTDGTTLYGTLKKGTKAGSAILTTPGVAPAPPPV